MLGTKTYVALAIAALAVLSSKTAVVIDAFSIGGCRDGGVSGRLQSTSLYSSSSSSSSSTEAPPVAVSRRKVLSVVATTATTTTASVGFLFGRPDVASAAPVTSQSASNKANESYQGVYSDPKHPDGYRILLKKGDGAGALMTLSDGLPKDSPPDAQEKVFANVPVSVENQKELTIDFSFKGGPKDIVGTLADDKQSITFQDGNVWTKNPNKYDGVYVDPKYPNGYRIIRKSTGTRFVVEMNDTGNPKDTKIVQGRIGSMYAIPTIALTFFYPGSGDEGVIGKLSLQDRNTVFSYGTITFNDGTVWTRV